MRLGSFHVEIHFQAAVIREFGRVDEFQITLTTLHEMDHLEVQIEVVSGNDAEHVRTQVEQAICRALSSRPTGTVAKAGALAHFELKARRFRRPQRPCENQQS